MSGLTYFVSLSNLFNRLLLACLFASALAYSPEALEPEEVTVVKIVGLVLSLTISTEILKACSDQFIKFCCPLGGATGKICVCI